MILALAMMFAQPACVALGPHSFQCQTEEQCSGVMRYDTAGIVQCDIMHSPVNRRLFRPAYRNECSSTAHLHPRNMKTDSPDVKGAALPVADGKCHADRTDQISK